MGVEDVGLHVGKRPADGHQGVGIGELSGVEVTGVEGFGQTVQVEQQAARHGTGEAPGEFDGERFAADAPVAQQRQAGGEVVVGVEHHAHQGRHQHHARDPVFGQQGDEGPRFKEHLALDQQAGYAVEQRAEEFPQGIDEVEGGFAGRHITGSEGVCAPHPGEAVEELALFDHHALGAAGGAGGEHHVGQAGGAGEAGRAAGGLGGDGRPVAVEAQHPGRVRRQHVEPALLAEEQADGGVFEHGREARRRVVRVEGHVAGAGLEDGENGDEEFGRALHGHADEGFVGDPEAGEMMGEAVGARVEFPVAEGRAGAEDGRGVRRAFGLGFEEARQGRIGRVVGVGGVPVDDELLPFGGGKEAQRRGRFGRVAGQVVEQAAVVAGHAAGGGGAEQGRVVDEAAAQLIALHFYAQAQVVGRGGGFDGERLQRELAGREPCRRCEAVVEEHLAYRRIAQVAGWLQGLDELFEG